MFRCLAPRRIAATPLARMTLPSGFGYQAKKIVDADASAQGETLTNLHFTLTRQDEALVAGVSVKSVTIHTTSGYLGVNAGHEYKVSKLLPGVIKVEVNDAQTDMYFAAGGFAHINNGGSLDINASECLKLDSFDLATAEKNLAAAEDMAKNGKSEKEKAVGEIQQSVLEPLVEALKANVASA
jgi:F0F1-type ATP synthase epsilon subunit